MSQGVAADMTTQTEVVQLAGLGSQAGFDVAQTFSVCQLREGHAQKLVQATKGANVEITTIFGNQTAERMPRCEFHDLGEDQLANVHSGLPEMSGKPA